MKTRTIQKLDGHFGQPGGLSYGRLYRLALRIMRNNEDAEEVLQETLLKAYRKIGQFEQRSNFATWIYRIAINEALMLLRKRRAHVPIDILSESTSPGPLQSNIAGPEATYYRRQLNNQLTRAIGSLCPANRMVFCLRVLEQVPTNEVAARLRISESCVKTRLRRAKATLREHLNTNSAYVRVSGDLIRNTC